MESLYETVLILFGTKNREIVKSCLGFIKAVSSVLPREKLLEHLKKTMDCVFHWVNDSNKRFRLKVKVIIERLIKKVGYESLQACIPVQHHKLLSSIKKQLNKAKKEAEKEKQKLINEKKAKKEPKGKKARKAEGEEGGDESESDLDSDEEFLDQFQSLPDNMVDHSDDDAEIVDLLDPNASKTVSRKKKTKKDKDDMFKIDKATGKIIVPKDDYDEGEKEHVPNVSVNELAGGKDESVMLKKRKRVMAQHDDDDDETDERDIRSQKGNPTKRQKLTKKQEKYTGEEYKASKSRGDVKKAGRHEPFAYLPMNPQLLNKRFLLSFFFF